MNVGGNILLHSYLRRGLPAIPGSCDHTTATLIALLALHQQDIGVEGDIAEIGVYLGKSFLVLANCLRHGEKITAIDTFEALVADNPDVMGGVGNREVFAANVGRWAPAARLEIIEQSSNKLEQGFYDGRRVRFFSIDGGHSIALTKNDLWVSQRVLTPRGIVLLDDILNVHWTGVITGLFEYWREGGTLCPAALIPNKLVLAPSEEDARLYKEFLRQVGGQAQTRRDVELGPYLIDVYEPNELIEMTDAGEILRQKVELQRLRAEVEMLHGKCEAMTHSRSWRITAPLRALRGLLR